jgi:uncharacterized membrane protein (TIGR02234 family)
MGTMTGNTSSTSSAARGKVVAALLALAGSGLILLSAGRGWARGDVTSPVRLAIEASGTSLTGVPTALGLAGLASAIALFAVRRIGRYVVGVAMAGAGIGTVAAVLDSIGRLDTKALARAATQTVGASASQIGSVSSTAWPYVTVGGAILLAMAGIYTLVRGREWTGLSNRYEREGASTDAAANSASPVDVAATATAVAGAQEAGKDAVEHSPRDLWDALNRGADPTL